MKQIVRLLKQYDQAVVDAQEHYSTSPQYKNPRIFFLMLLPFTLEVFLRHDMGRGYANLHRVFGGAVVFMFMAVIANIQWDMRSISQQLEAWEFTASNGWNQNPFEKLLMHTPYLPIPNGFHSLDLAEVNAGWIAFTLFIIFALWQFTWAHLRTPKGEMQNTRSPGEVFPAFAVFQVMCHRLKIHLDLTKVLLEPVFCIWLGNQILDNASPYRGTDGMAFFGYWLILGGIALMIKSYIESSAMGYGRDQEMNTKLRRRTAKWQRGEEPSGKTKGNYIPAP